MNSYSPYSNPGGDYYYEGGAARISPSPTPSPRRSDFYSYAQHTQTPQRPATRAHFRQASTGYSNEYSSPRPPPAFSPRYTSDGHYATANVSSSRSSRKPSVSSPRPKRERSNSYSYYNRTSDSLGETDEDDYFEYNGRAFVWPMPARPKSGNRRSGGDFYYAKDVGGHGTDGQFYSQQGYSFFNDPAYSNNSPRPPRPETAAGARRPANTHVRRSSTSMTAAQQRPATAAGHRPKSSHKKPAPIVRKATEEDAKRHRIPTGYSLKNWDPTEEPIMLLGSVFDANSLGKWIYDWTVFHHGANTPISDMAGELWLLLIQLAGKVKRSEECVPRIRTRENREMVEDFIESGERLTDKLRKLLKFCEKPMLEARSKKQGAQLGNNAGVEFVETLFSRDREADRTDKFMAAVRTWNLRFDANCEEIMRKPGM